MSLNTSFKKITGLGSAKDGTEHWWMQRVTAIALVPLTLWFVYSILTVLGSDYYAAKIWLTQPFNAFLMILFVSISFFHAYLGIKVVIEDYINCEYMKLASIISKQLAFLVVGAASIFAILTVYFKG